MDSPPHTAAHKHCKRHRTEILASERCGCFYCLAVFDPSEIPDWLDETLKKGLRTSTLPKGFLGTLCIHLLFGPKLHSYLRTIRAKACACAAGVLLSMSVQPALALQVDPGDYTPLPGGTDLLLVYYQHLTADDFHVNGDKVLDNLDLTLDVAFIRYVHYFEVGSWLIVPDVNLTFGRQEIALTGQTLSGVGDLTFGATFSPWHDLKNSFGVTLYLTAPAGEEKNQGFALSGNRWGYELEAGYIRRIAPKWTIDLVGHAQAFQDQRDTDLEQDPVYEADVSVSYHISDATHVALSYRHTWGGETTLNGVTQTGNLNDDTVIFTWASFLSKQWQLQLQWRQDVNIEEGPKIQGIQTRLLYLF